MADEDDKRREAMREMCKDMTCDCCKRGPVVGVASSGFGAVSFAWCAECLAQPAEPEMMFEYLYDDVGSKGEGLIPQLDGWSTWSEGSYIKWPEWRDKRRVAEGLQPLGTEGDGNDEADRPAPGDGS